MSLGSSNAEHQYVVSAAGTLIYKKNSHSVMIIMIDYAAFILTLTLTLILATQILGRGGTTGAVQLKQLASAMLGPIIISNVLQSLTRG